ncbi:hypothetical protein D915_006521 [Fasciola hepatica]|uniref:CUB domain-containing protein n=1 Tax=Fasciola hepatica TaxID=6192 RepID=A0A4E0R6V9_FASHE|nr:hypothetical protein D915_006521 [Fasciola hepatica]
MKTKNQKNNTMNYKSLLFALFLYACKLPQGTNAQQSLCGPGTLNLGPSETSLNVPTSGNFTNVTKCEYTVTGDAGKRITIMITSLNLGTGGNCDKDYIKVANTKAELASTQMYTCGDKEQNFTVNSNQMAIEIQVTNELSKDFVKAILVQNGCNPVTTFLHWISLILVSCFSVDHMF